MKVLAAATLAVFLGLGVWSEGAWGEGAGGEGALLPTGQAITPQAAPGAVFQDLDPKVAARPDFRAGQAVAIAPSPDGSQGLVLTSGYNRAAGARDEYVFRYDLTRSTPRLRQVVTVPNSFQGIAWAPDGESFEVSGGVDDVIHSFRREKEEFVEIQPPIALRHSKGVGLEVSPLAAGLAISPDGRRLLVTNFQNDSVSLVDLDHRLVLDEHDLRPGNGIGGGEFPLSVVWRDAGTAYVASQRDRELIVLTLAADRITVRERIKLEGVPTALLLDQRTKRLFVACDNSDTVRVIDTATDQVAFDLGAGIPSRLFPNPRGLKGAGPNGLALSPEGETLYVTLGGLNALAVIPVKAGAQPVGLIPTGWYPTGVAVSGDGERLFVINGKSPTGPNPGACRDTLALATDALQGCLARERYVWQLEKAGLLSLPRPPAATLAALTRQVAINDHIDARAAVPRLGWLAAKVKHVIYVVKENRSYDQVLGDLEIGDGDPELTLFPEALTPNHHRLARAFVTVDNFFDSGEVSSNGWLWSTAARSTDFIEKETPVHYAGRGLQYDSEGLNRNIDVGLPPEERRAVNPAIPDDPDLLPGTGDVAAPAGGYLWDAARQAGVSVRNYGFYGDLTLYDGLGAKPAPLERMPFRRRVPVFQATKPALADVTDPYFRGFDMRFPDFWRVREWQRDFADLVRRHAVPRLMLVRLPHDHFGSFNEAIDGVDTVETQIADNDYAVGTLVETIAKSPIRDETVIFIVEDDAQNGADHVDAHRSLLLVAGAPVRRHALVVKRATTVSLMRTIEELLELPPLGLDDALAAPMAELFTAHPSPFTYRAVIAPILGRTSLPLGLTRALAPACGTEAPRDAVWWQEVLGDQDYRGEDRLETVSFNEGLWRGRKGEGAASPHFAEDLRAGRTALLAAFRRVHGCAPQGFAVK